MTMSSILFKIIPSPMKNATVIIKAKVLNSGAAVYPGSEAGSSTGGGLGVYVGVAVAAAVGATVRGSSTPVLTGLSSSRVSKLYAG